MTKPASIDGDFTPQRDDAVSGVELDGEVVLYNERANTVHILNRTATLVWNCLDGEGDLDSLARELAAVFGLDVKQMRDDVIRIVRMFGRQGLLVDVQPDPAVVLAQTLGFDPGSDQAHG